MGQNFIELHNDKADLTEFLCKVYFLRIPVQYVVLFTQSYIEKYKELNECGDNLLLHAVKHSYIYDVERKSMIIGGNGR